MSGHAFSSAALNQIMREQRRASCAAAKAFVNACQTSDVKAFLTAFDQVRISADGWRLAILATSKLTAVSPAIHEVFLDIWIESKNLPFRIGNRSALAKCLRALLPPTQSDSPLCLYRGASYEERRRRIYGFSWTTDLKIAREFAHNWVEAPGGAVILEVEATPDALLLVCEEHGYCEESEVIVDPFKLKNISILERIRD